MAQKTLMSRILRGLRGARQAVAENKARRGVLVIPRRVMANPPPQQPTAPAKPFELVIACNFHYGDEDEWYTKGVYATLDAAIEAGKRIVDGCLEHKYRPGMTAETLDQQYRWFGEDPFIRGAGLSGVPFSAWTYAKARCAEICAEPKEPSK